MGRPRETEEAKTARLYRRGLTLQQVAAQTGMSLSIVRESLIRAGVPRRERGRRC